MTRRTMLLILCAAVCAPALAGAAGLGAGFDAGVEAGVQPSVQPSPALRRTCLQIERLCCVHQWGHTYHSTQLHGI